MDKVEELLRTRNQVETTLEKLKTPVTILFSDIRGSTSFFMNEGDIEGIAMIERHNSILFPIITKNSGRVVKTVGDAIMAVFKDPRCALAAAAGMQQALSADNELRAPNQKINIRIGMHSGLGLEKNRDVYGDVVNTASRVEHHAEPNQICISESLLDHANQLGLSPCSIGPVEFKGKLETMTIYKLNWQGCNVAAIPASNSGTKFKPRVIVAAAALLLAVGGWLGFSYWNPTPVNSPLTQGQLEERLFDDSVVKAIFEKAGKPVGSAAFRVFKDAAAEPSNSPITRAKFAMILEDLMILSSGRRAIATESLGENSPFRDVESSRPEFNAIMTATKYHLMDVHGDAFDPQGPILPSMVETSLKALQESAPGQ